MPSIKNFEVPVIEAVDVETWEHMVAGETWITRFDRFGNVLPQKLQGKGRTFQVTPEERRAHEGKCAHPSLNPYRNGRCVPVKLVDSAPETAELKANPDAMTETAMKALFNSQIATFNKKVGAITNVLTLQRLLEVAEEVDAKSSQIKTIQARIEAIQPDNGPVKVRTFNYDDDPMARRGTNLSRAA